MECVSDASRRRPMSSQAQSGDFRIPVSYRLHPGESLPIPQGSEPAPVTAEGLVPIPPIHPCRLSLPEGCYQLSITNTPVGSPTRLRSTYRLGTLRVVKSGSTYAISGDTYRYSW